MLFNFGLYVSLLIFIIGLIYKLWKLFHKDVGMGAKEVSAHTRFFFATKGMLATVFSGKIFILTKVFVLDVILQLGILKDSEDRILWIMHILVFVGFILLLLMHALGGIITSSLLNGCMVNPHRNQGLIASRSISSNPRSWNSL